MASKAAGQRRRPTQERAKATREQILDTAARLFGERGIANTSTNRIAAEAGMSIGTVYRYFSDRTVIVEELLARLLENIEKRATDSIFDRSDATMHELTARLLNSIAEELVANALLVRALVAGVQFYSSGIPEFEPRLRLLIKVLLIQVLGPGDDHEYDVMTFVIINTGFSAVLRASAIEFDERQRREAIDMTAHMIGDWIEAEAARRSGEARVPRLR
ncbi:MULTISPECIES: TetR/AcrR family transcriptional regulator [Nocardia]|jgi:AcrR family transcriptional regulator|uniref:TetR/AcrR family transcriptional regulator n=1 Tax=Nocardia nova TaxID=37330 RepID=A0A2S6ADJ0_9NOCA|nr:MULTISPECIES: TetR/AcrR family transcriptional regulator [Nocardia]OBF83216.1 TetR family transcriptional regulator [Mycobacterium sp. 852002-51759_SCH5129042]MBF6146031.1 TetR/AcrR family transcriptional regulator [Nocardia nova]MBF6273088.1 TetR/AcrR family transcriptional regulator [Nocardia nova]MDN2499180.1 TetR/AcrR family transcriptional regulator [Nocardia nova]OBA41465.1 TetR family transcriptional regulator [Nocardia sp. 852002-51101_SCH5132738]